MIPIKSKKRAFEVDDLFRFQYSTEAQISPNGKYAVYVLMNTNQEKAEELSNLWLLNLENNESKQLTFGTWADYSPVWSPSGTQIAFFSSRDGKPQIYLLQLDGGEAQKITSLSQGCGGSLLWSPDETKLLFSAGVPNPRDASQPYRVKRPIYRFDGAGYVDDFIKQIQVLNLRDHTVTQLTHDDWNHTATAWSPDSKEILFLANLNPDSIFTSASMKVMDLNGIQRVLLTNEWGMIQNAVWLSNGKIAFSGVPAGNLLGTKSDLWVMNSDGSEIECRTASLSNGINGHLHDDFPVLWSFSSPPILASSNAEEALVNVQVGGEMHIYQVSLIGEESMRLLASGERFCFPFNRTAEKVLLGVSTLLDPTQLFVLDIPTAKETQLTTLNQTLLNEIQFPELKNIHFKSSDGADVEGWLMIPQGTAPFPTILHIHGGPHYAYGHSFYFDFLTLAGAGYAVLFINHRGSTGYGNKFATATHADWGNLDYQDLIAGVDHAIELGIADPNKLGCCGVSGGGNLSCWIVGHTHRFKAAVPENPATNFVSLYGTSDVGPVFVAREMGGKPHEVPETYMRCSPITYAHQCKTPTLFVIGENDYRCPPEQAEQFYTTLKANGCITEMVRLPNSSHDGATIGPFAGRRMHNEVLLDWMNRFVK